MESPTMSNATSTNATTNDVSMPSAPAAEAGERIRERVEHARETFERVRKGAEMTFREKPYLLPLVAGAVGLGVGVLLSSRITRFILSAAVGAVLTEVLGSEIKRVSCELMSSLHERLDEGETKPAE
jgi:ElaB/YqjD/DUF883 family membrane-anchored ribosome-binding protein